MKKINQPITKGVAKTPVVMQLEALECGAASLAMILAYYDKWVPLEQVRIDCGVSRDGSSAKNIYKCAEAYGLNVSAYKFELEDFKTDCTFPCIIHWNFNHFVVLNGFKGNKVYINDPARGEVKITLSEFDEAFTGVVLMFEPSENFVPSGKKKTTIDYIKERTSGLGNIVAYALILTILASFISMIYPVFSRIFYDRILTGTNPEWQTPFLICIVIVSLFQVIISFVTVKHNARTSGKLDIVGSSSYMWKVLRLPMNFFSQRMSGDILSRKSSNATISKQIVDILAPLFINGLMMVFYFIVMIRYSIVLTIIAVITTLVNIIFSQLMMKKRINSSRIAIRDSAKLSAVQMSGIEMIETIKASGAENGYFGRYAGYQASANNGLIEYTKTAVNYQIIPEIVSSLCNIIILAVGVYLTINGEFTLGMISAFQAYLSNFLSPVNSFISSGEQLQEMQTSMERVDDVMKYPTDQVFDSSKNEIITDYSKLSGNVELKNVTFGYSILDEPLIKDFNMSIKKGSRVAFVGTSGCGKSTLAKLISGINHQWSGSITFDGKSIEQIDRNIFTGSVAVVDQDIILFSDTIRNNIKMWDNSIEDFEMILAARDAQIHDAIMQRDGGYDYKISESGKSFSGGEKQRLEIARVLAQDPTICILDEATSALDAKTEYDVVEAIKNRGITCIIIAHRLSTIRDCDEIVVLDHGNVVERGNHEELIKLNGYYANLINND